MLACWTIDFAEISNGVSGKTEFLDRVKEQIRRPPPHLSSFAVEQHIIARGVVKIQVAGDSPGLSGQYQICDLKTVGWYVAVLVSPRKASPP